MNVTPVSLKDAILTDLWVHLAGLLAISIGLLSNKYLGTTFSNDTQLIFIIGGFAAMGLKLTNGTVAAVANAAAQAVQETARTTAAALVLSTAEAAKSGNPVPPIPPANP